MASLKEDTIDFNKLESGAQSAMDAENLYWLRNEAKFRAVKQKGTYEEFKEIVAAAHLKPLEKGDKLQLDEKIVAPWNSTVNAMSDKKTVESTSSHADSQPVEALPRNSQAFIRAWRTLTSDEAKIRFLMLNSKTENLMVLFKTELPSDLLGQFLLLLSDGCQCHQVHCTEIHKVLTDFTKLGRFEMGLLFMSQAEKEALKYIVERLKEDSGLECENLLVAYQIG